LLGSRFKVLADNALQQSSTIINNHQHSSTIINSRQLDLVLGPAPYDSCDWLTLFMSVGTVAPRKRLYVF
jgi:hypothetical protein